MTSSPAPIRVYTTNFCGYCVRAKRLLEKRGLSYEEINLAGDADQLGKLRVRTGLRTLPQIFVGETFVGGSDELAALDRAGELLPLYERESSKPS